MQAASRPSDTLVATTEADRLVTDRPAWIARRQYAAWSWSPDFVGWVLWGHFADDDAEEGKQLWIQLARRMKPPYDFVLDLRRLESVSRGAFERIREFAKTGKPGLRKMVVLVGNETSGGMIQVGLFTLQPPPYPWASFTDPAAAARWLDRPGAAEALDAAERLASNPDPRGSPLADVRKLLAENPSASIAEVARATARSSRALQRLLEEHGTTFLDERDRARVMKAQELLLSPETKLEAIAAAIGCADRRSLNRLFRRVTGESPSEFRARRGLVAPQLPSRQRP